MQPLVAIIMGSESDRPTLQHTADQLTAMQIPFDWRVVSAHRTPDLMFDFAEQGMVTGSRDTTTVATQALYLLNDSFVRQQAQGLAERLLKRTDLDDAGRMDLAYRLVVARGTTAKEVERVRNYLAEYEAESRKEGGATTEARGAAWASFTQALLASAEFRYLR